MKTIKLLLAITVSLLSFKNLNATGSINTSTFNPCAPPVTVTAIANTYGCYSITASTVTANDLDSYYHWTFQDGTTGTGKTIYHCCSPVSSPTNYTFTVNYINPLILCPAPVIVPVNTITLLPPPSTLCVYNTPSVSLAANSVTVWAGITIPEIFTYFNYGDGSAITYVNEHNYVNCGNYIIKVKQWDMNIPNDTCYAYAAVNIPCEIATGLKENQNTTKINLYPNPGTDVLFVKTTLSIKEITVFDVLGKKIELPVEMLDQQSIAYTKDILPGSYFVKIKFENGQESYKKFVKQ